MAGQNLVNVVAAANVHKPFCTNVVFCNHNSIQLHNMPTTSEHAWGLDAIQVESTPLTTTGGHVWQAAYRLASYLASTAHQWNLHRPGIRILELGAGCGYLGLTLALHLPHAHICVTEQEDGGALAWLQHNVEAQQAKHSRLQNIRAAACDWTHVEQGGGLFNEAWDVILGSDLVYNEICATYLPKVLARLMQGPKDACKEGDSGGSVVALYCHTKHRYDLLDIELEQQLARNGLRLQEVWEPNASPPRQSPPVEWPGDLFGEQRRAVYNIVPL